MNYLTLFKEKFIESSEQYPQNDIGITRLFYDLHSGYIRYVSEAKSWYAFDGQRWDEDRSGFKTMELSNYLRRSSARSLL